MGDRSSGRTLRMVRDIPVTGALVIVHNYCMRQYVRAMIADVRGSDVLKACNVVVVSNRDDAHRRLIGWRGHVAVDHAFDEYADSDTRVLVSHLVAGICAVSAA